ncbi:ABC transporter substrate-binding protein [Moritella sp. Urea-trap-13]|uniref:ABC transporter substrate-binding protein n=1 Tax=Moritella sp. Urea-trap-13 TaxID=2058327 RepID=UPI000C31F74A|nr:ABC transporter substrate-binding protein [Moritella sp. Urea-trap-13]PKH06331.1 peptide ABC transporter substrate-binding protein [Moritella sp. Urea-trap-13]
MHSKKILASIVCGLLISANGVMAEDIKQGGTLTVPIINTGFVENFNPYTTAGLYDGLMFEPLMMFNNMTGKVEYRLAKSAEYSKDLKTITITLRDGLTWSDSKPLTAKDVAFSYTMTKTAPAFDQKAIWTTGNLISVTATDEKTVVFKLNKADSTFIWSLPKYHIVPEHIWGKVAAKDLPTFMNLNPVGSGPLTDVKYVKAQQIQLCRNDSYYLENRPYIDCMIFRSYNDNSQIQPALMKGDIDWGSNFIADIDNTFVAADPKNNHYWYPANDAIHLYVNTKEKPFDDLNVRKALSMALNRDEIVDIAAYGYPIANFNAGGIGELYGKFINKDISEKYKEITTYNPVKANELLDQSGYKDSDGDGFREIANGENIEFDINVVNGWTDWIQVVQMVTEYYEEIGIKANVKTVDWSVYDSGLKDSKYKMSINWSMVATNPIEAYQTYFLSSQIGKSWHAGHGVRSPEIENLIKSFGLTNDAKKQQDILDQLQEFTAENMPFIPLFSNATWFQYSTAKFIGWPNEKNPYVQPVFYSSGNRNLIINNLHLK